MIKGNNIMTIDGHPVSVTYEAEIKAFCGKFLDFTGYCDFVSNSIEGLTARLTVATTSHAVSKNQFIIQLLERNYSNPKQMDANSVCSRRMECL